MFFIINPNISIDCVVFGFDYKQLNVLLAERVLRRSRDREYAFTDHTLIGIHIHDEKNLEEAAHRILKGWTGIEDIYLEQFLAFANPQRLKDEKDQCLASAYWACS